MPADDVAFTPGKTVDGHPDLQGKWNYATVTPFERPKEFASKATFTAAEAAAFEQARHHMGVSSRARGGRHRLPDRRDAGCVY